jgi:hypothetical protein
MGTRVSAKPDSAPTAMEVKSEAIALRILESVGIHDDVQLGEWRSNDNYEE